MWSSTCAAAPSKAIEAENGEIAIEKLKQNPDICLALLDVMLPDIDGFEVCRRIRATGSKMGIIMLTAEIQEIDKVTGLWPAPTTTSPSPAELTAHVDALMHHLGVDEEEKNSIEIVIGPFSAKRPQPYP
ncbi:MAG: response regulator [Oscillospiraceae bacterium]